MTESNNKPILLFCLFLVCYLFASGKASTDSLMKQLDSVIARAVPICKIKRGGFRRCIANICRQKMTWRDSTCYCTFMTNTIHLILIRHIT